MSLGRGEAGTDAGDDGRRGSGAENGGATQAKAGLGCDAGGLVKATVMGSGPVRASNRSLAWAILIGLFGLDMEVPPWVAEFTRQLCRRRRRWMEKWRDGGT